MKILTCIFLSVLFIGLTGCKISTTYSTRAGYVSSRTPGEVLKGSERFSTGEKFQPPVEITIVAMTDSTNLRIGYAANQVIFNWEIATEELRVDGGPADGRHTAGAGNIPSGKYVTIKWLVTPGHQAIFVDDELRFEHSGDYSHIDNYVSVFPAVGSKVTVKSVTVKPLKPMRTGLEGQRVSIPPYRW